MAGKPGRSGGKRKGSGRPVESWRLRNGDCLAVWETDGDGRQIGTGRLATISVGSRTVLYIALDDGTEIKLVR